MSALPRPEWVFDPNKIVEMPDIAERAERAAQTAGKFRSWVELNNTKIQLRSGLQAAMLALLATALIAATLPEAEPSPEKRKRRRGERCAREFMKIIQDFINENREEDKDGNTYALNRALETTDHAPRKKRTFPSRA